MLVTLNDVDVQGKTILLRADLNVPVDQGSVRDMTRIDRLKPSVDYLRARGARVLILSHFGRPNGTRDPAFSLGFLASVCTERWQTPVVFVPESVGPIVHEALGKLKTGEIALLENVRFHANEEKNDPALAAQWAALCDVYVNDAFSVAHRAHASVEAIAHLRPSAAGFLMAEEVSALTRVLEAPMRPVVAVVGGSKVSTKIDLLSNLVTRVDHVIVGGGMANIFLLAQGREIGGSLCERSMLETARSIMTRAEGAGCQFHVPVDGVVARSPAHPDTAHIQTLEQGVGADHAMLDIGPQTIARFAHVIANSRTVLWNGPMGVFEMPAFAQGTHAIGQAIAGATKEGAVTVAGGGDTVAALMNLGLTTDSMTYVSTAGGAFLEYCEGKTLPGVAVLMPSAPSKAANF